MNWKAWVALPIAAAGMGCSSGGPGSPSQPMAVSKSRFVNTAPSLGNAQLHIGSLVSPAAPRQASNEFVAPLGSVQVTVTAGGQTASQTFNLDDRPMDFVAQEFPAGQLRVDWIDRRFTPPGATFLEYFNFSDGLTLQDVYVVPTGTTIAGVAPLLTSVQAGQGAGIAPGMVDIVITPAGRKTILFQSKPVTIASGEQLFLGGVPASAHVVTPSPLVLGLATFASLDDARPEIRMVHPVDGSDTGYPTTINVDGDVIVNLPDKTASFGESYHLSPGPHTLGAARPFNILAGMDYVQSWGNNGFGSDADFHDWRVPIAAGTGPVPADKARVVLLVENCCRANIVKIDGAPIDYPNQAIGNPGAAFDHAAGAIQVDVFGPDGLLAEGSRTVTLQAGHSYLVRIWGGQTAHSIPTYPDGQAVPRIFEISES